MAELAGLPEDLHDAARLAETMGASITIYNSGVKNNEDNGIRVFRGSHWNGHFDGGHIYHCSTGKGTGRVPRRIEYGVEPKRPAERNGRPPPRGPHIFGVATGGQQVQGGLRKTRRK